MSDPGLCGQRPGSDISWRPPGYACANRSRQSAPPPPPPEHAAHPSVDRDC